MTDKFKRVAYLCQWCGKDLHDIDWYGDEHSMHPMAIYNDYDGKQYCSIYCAQNGYSFYNYKYEIRE